MRSKELSFELRDRIVSRHRSVEGYQKMSAALKKNTMASIILQQLPLSLLYLFYLFILLLCTPLFGFLLCTFFHYKSTKSTIYHSLLTSYIDLFFYCIIDCMLVYPMCNSMLLYVSNCFALSWPGRNCK